MSWFAITAGEGILVPFSADSVDADCEVMVGDGCASGFDSPHGFTQGADGSGGVENDFGSVEAEHEPVEWMMSSVADVDGDFAEFRFEDWVSGVAFHIVGAFIEVTDSRDVIFVVSSEDFTVVVEDDGRIVDGTFDIVSFEDVINDDHIVFF